MTSELMILKIGHLAAEKNKINHLNQGSENGIHSHSHKKTICPQPHASKLGHNMSQQAANV